MKRYVKISLAGIFCGCLLIGCGRTDEAVTVESAAKAVEKSETEAKTAPAATQGAGGQTQSAPVREMNDAMTAYKTGNYEDAVARLQKLRSQPASSASQAMAIQDATAAIMNELAALAAKGDVRAKQAIERYQKLQGH